MNISPYPGLDYLFLCVIHDNKCGPTRAAELICMAVVTRAAQMEAMVKVKER